MNRIKRNGSTYRWRKVRQQILKRDNYVCFYCGNTQANSVDHKSPVKQGGTDDPTNLVACCERCNYSKGARTTSQWQQAKRKQLKRMKISDFFEQDKTSPTPAMFLSPKELKTPFQKPEQDILDA